MSETQRRVVVGDRVKITQTFRQDHQLGKVGTVDRVLPAMWDSEDHICYIKLDDEILTMRTMDRPGWLTLVESD